MNQGPPTVSGAFLRNLLALIWMEITFVWLGVVVGDWTLFIIVNVMTWAAYIALKEWANK